MCVANVDQLIMVITYQLSEHTVTISLAASITDRCTLAHYAGTYCAGSQSYMLHECNYV